ncbi:MAG: S-adenosylmethionine synthetase, partial [Deltaproteobacteria bacterium]
LNGLISMNWPMGTEAAAGKNRVSQAGKIYNVLAHKIAKQGYREIDGIKEVYIIILSRIGTPIDDPPMVTAQISLEQGRRIKEISNAVSNVFEREFANIRKFCADLSMGRYTVC